MKSIMPLVCTLDGDGRGETHTQDEEPKEWRGDPYDFYGYGRAGIRNQGNGTGYGVYNYSNQTAGRNDDFAVYHPCQYGIDHGR